MGSGKQLCSSTRNPVHSCCVHLPLNICRGQLSQARRGVTVVARGAHMNEARLLLFGTSHQTIKLARAASPAPAGRCRDRNGTPKWLQPPSLRELESTSRSTRLLTGT